MSGTPTRATPLYLENKERQRKGAPALARGEADKAGAPRCFVILGVLGVSPTRI